MPCSVTESSHIIGKKWSIPILQEIALGKFAGFNKFLAQTKYITPRILSKQLKELEAAGLVKKRHYSRKTAYTLTQKGLDLHNIITEMKKWNIKWNNVPGYCLENSCITCARFRA